MTATAPFMSAAPRPWTAPSSRRPGRLPCAGTVSRWPASSTSGRSPRSVTPASTQVSPASRAPGTTDRMCAASVASSRDSDGMSMSSRARSARSVMGEAWPLDWTMRMQRSRNGRSIPTHSPNGVSPGRARQRALMVAALPDGDDLRELEELLRTAGVAVAGQLVQHRDHPHANTYIGPGKLDEVKGLIKRLDANVVVADDELSPRQGRNLEGALDGVPVVDRTTVILDIFADHAHSAEGKLQVELAQLEYNLARMRGLWTHLERLGAGRMDGGIGTRGPGESQIETDRRLARDRIAALKRRVAHTKGTRQTMRRERERAALPTVALAGYTNAGKSTLLNGLTGSTVGVR